MGGLNPNADTDADWEYWCEQYEASDRFLDDLVDWAANSHPALEAFRSTEDYASGVESFLEDSQEAV